VQIATGVVLMHYVPTPEGAFDSVEKIMRDVIWGWFLRYTHAVGARVATASREDRLAQAATAGSTATNELW
jgi:ubiquinol-cytochrome c reductase cytochrome b subunit